jgi:peptide/nickel transport system permease protein
MALAGETGAALEVPTVVPELAGTSAGEAPAINVRRDIWRRFRRNKLALFGLALIIVLVFFAIFGSLLAPYSPTRNFVGPKLEQPTVQHWFGTDQLGRDVFSRVIAGARYSMLIGVGSALLATIVGVVLGAIAGYYGSWVDGLLMRLTDIFLALPYIVFAIVLVMIFGHSMWVIIVVLGGLGWMPISRIFRSSILQTNELEFIDASRALGCSNSRIIIRHVMPNSIQPVIVYGTIAVGTAILSEAALSFLAVGAQEPTPSWGLMTSNAATYLQDGQWYVVLFPGLAIFLAVLAFVFFGDGLRDALDPRLRK